MRKRLCCGWCLFLLLSSGLLYQTDACTIFMATDGQRVMLGNNEDWVTTDTIVRVYPASEGQYGRILFGFSDGVTQGGMNEMGLAMDANKLPEEDSANADRIARNTDMDTINDTLATCATVGDVIAGAMQAAEVMGVDVFREAQLLVADRHGGSVIISVGPDDRLHFSYRTGDFQASSNFNVTHPRPENTPADELRFEDLPYLRYDTVVAMLTDNPAPEVDNFRAILSAVRMEGQVEGFPNTVYSNIFDLTNGEVYIYNFHDFATVVRLNLAEEIQKGAQYHTLNDLFPRRTYPQITPALYTAAIVEQYRQAYMRGFEDAITDCR